MAIELTARLNLETISTLVHELTPCTVQLGAADEPEKWIQINRPHRVELRPQEGIAIHTTALLQWSVAGLEVPVTIQSVVVLLRPVPSDAGDRLNVLVTLDSMDLKNIPNLVD